MPPTVAPLLPFNLVDKSSRDKGKQPATATDIMFTDPFSKPSSTSHSYSSFPSSSIATSFSPSSPASSSNNANVKKQNRTSSLLSFKRRKSVQSSGAGSSVGLMPGQRVILPDVIEISATTAMPRLEDEEVEERTRLKDAAAKALGLVAEPDVLVLASESNDNGADARNDDKADPRNHDQDNHSAFEERLSPRHTSMHSRSNSTSAVSSIAAPTTPTSPASIPSYPTTLLSLRPYIQKEATLPKYHASSRLFTLSKHWKPRYIVFTSPPPSPIQHQNHLPGISFGSQHERRTTPLPSYLHLFKTSNASDLEIERLEINEDSVVFVAEEAIVGGRKSVIKVGGLGVGGTKSIEDDKSMWLLQIVDAAEAQKWIEVVKSKILSQRSMRAGLGLPALGLNSIEPKGDMDVMLSMRAQGIFTPSLGPNSTQGNSYFGHSASNIVSSTSTNQDSASVSSTSAQSGKLKRSMSPTGGAVSALKGLFSSSSNSNESNWKQQRPRSPSSASSIYSSTTPSLLSSATSEADHKPAAGDESFGSAGASLLQMKHNNGTGAKMIQRTSSSGHAADGPLTELVLGSQQPSLNQQQIGMGQRILPPHLLERRIGNTSHIPGHGITRTERAISLQPPPRKRWTDIKKEEQERKMYGTDANGSLVTIGSTPLSAATTATMNTPEVLSYSEPHHSKLGSSSTVAFGNGNESMLSVDGNGQRPRAGSIQSVSTVGSSMRLSLDQSSTGGAAGTTSKRGSKRWSRQTSMLPRRLTPPSGPPPLAPSSQQSPSQQHPSVEVNRSPSRSSTSSQRSVISNLPTFSKRASVSSAVSIGTSPSITRPNSAHRTSMPPPQKGPAPTAALPAAPSSDADVVGRNSDKTHEIADVPHVGKHSRAFRLSLNAPTKPPPSIVLPPRPDESGPTGSVNNLKVTHTTRRLSSPSNFKAGGDLSLLATIPGSPALPAPVRPLPHLPLSSTPNVLERPATPPSRGASIKRRLRMLSAPSSSSAPSHATTFGDLSQHLTPPSSPSAHQRPPNSPRPTSLIPSTSLSSSVDIPATPIGEYITPPWIQNDPSFIRNLPPLPNSPTSPVGIGKIPTLEPPPEQESYPQLKSLSPPPRRASKVMAGDKRGAGSGVGSGTNPIGESIGYAENNASDVSEKQEDGRVSLSLLERRGSVISLGIVNV